ncbi:Apolipoprotein N-acyltransferase [Sterolibacterium denitrificans]|uniref:Apolipoprotein N-acyltransferase n=1 Tax=Sterolibacterium denitrificans TaxID=157592 RepID=A0A7Z7HR67_9PROT|nr:apolipoprotein N-acyltransferase [Sterolibacterium denitrificans]SMB25955.1 Apolipoprotein N-acyltransferase [Sterolibacterium denitrificans]
MNRARLLPVAAFLLGALSVLGYAPFALFPLPVLSLAALFLLWRGAASARSAAWLGWLWGCGVFLCGVSWVYISLHDMAGMFAPVAAGATLALCMYMALFPALAGALFARLRSGRPFADTLLAAGSWTLSEWLRGWLLTGFPWLASGYAHTPPSPLAGYAAVVGVYGIGLFAAIMAGLIAFGLQRRQTRGTWMAVVAVLLLIPACGALLTRMDWTQPQGEPLTVSLLQGNVPQDGKWNADRISYSLATYAELLHAHPAQLVVMPETALPMLLDHVPRDYLAMLMDKGPVLTGVAATARESGYPGGPLNIALAISQGQELQYYAKTHLVPFGEYIPPGFAWFMDMMHMPMADFIPGPRVQKPLEIAGQQIAANICYEDLFGEEIIRALPQATLLINLSNTAWFGDSLAQPQHLQIARLRALETGRTMLRATNTGMTAAIAPDGRIIGVLPPFISAGLTVEVQGYGGTTPYVRWGNKLAVTLALLALLPAWRARRNARTG